jgi:hypothetical protein
MYTLANLAREKELLQNTSVLEIVETQGISVSTRYVYTASSERTGVSFTSFILLQFGVVNLGAEDPATCDDLMVISTFRTAQ